MSRPISEAQALAERKARHAQAREAKAKLVAAAGRDYLDGTCESAKVAAQGRGVSEWAVLRWVKAQKARRACQTGSAD